MAVDRPLNSYKHGGSHVPTGRKRDDPPKKEINANYYLICDGNKCEEGIFSEGRKSGILNEKQKKIAFKYIRVSINKLVYCMFRFEMEIW